MNIMAIIVGWIFILLFVITFSDVVGVIKSIVFKEKSFKAEIIQRNLMYKLPFTLTSILIYLYIR